MSELEDFLATTAVFKGVSRNELREIAGLFREEKYAEGELILRQGRVNQKIYFLRSGELSVRVNRLEGRETVAFLLPPAVFGELSFITGRTCSADVEVEVEAEVVVMDKSDLAGMPRQREEILRGMMVTLAERLHDTVTRGLRAPREPVVLLHAHRNWAAPHAFAASLGCSLARQTGKETLVVNLGSEESSEDVRELAAGAFILDRSLAGGGDLQAETVAELGRWKKRFTHVILNPLGESLEDTVARTGAFADFRGFLLGPGDPLPESDPAGQFVVQDVEYPTLGRLSGRSQLIRDASESEQAYLSGQPAGARFLRTVDSIARYVGGSQVGIALGGGAAWGWAHIGVLSVLQEAGFPLDVVAGCSMGSVIGALYCTGRTISELRQIADYWRKRTRRFLEFRIWKMHLIREKMFQRVFLDYFGDLPLTRLETPFWVNAVDIKNGREFCIHEGPVVDALRASVAMPGLLPPCERGSHLLVDAGITNPVPVNLVREMGCRYAIAVNAMVPLEAQEVMHRYPLNIFDILFRCMRITGREIGEARIAGMTDVALSPRLDEISMLEFDRSEEIIAAGRKAAEENLEVIRSGYERVKKAVPRDQL